MGRSPSPRKYFPAFTVSFNSGIVDKDASASDWRQRMSLILGWLGLELGIVLGQVTLTPLDNVASAAVLREQLACGGQLRQWIVPKVDGLKARWMSHNPREDCRLLRSLRSVALAEYSVDPLCRPRIETRWQKGLKRFVAHSHKLDNQPSVFKQIVIHGLFQAVHN